MTQSPGQNPPLPHLGGVEETCKTELRDVNVVGSAILTRAPQARQSSLECSPAEPWSKESTGTAQVITFTPQPHPMSLWQWQASGGKTGGSECCLWAAENSSTSPFLVWLVPDANSAHTGPACSGPTCTAQAGGGAQAECSGGPAFILANRRA